MNSIYALISNFGHPSIPLLKSQPESEVGGWRGGGFATKFELFIRDSHNAHSSTFVSPKVGQS